MICFLYILSLFALLGFGYYQGDSSWWLALINSFRYWLFAPALLFWLEIVWDGFSEGKTWGLSIVTVLWVFLYIWFPFYETPTAAGKQTIKAMTFNILYLNENINGIISPINKAQPDIIAMQEITENQGQALKQQLSAVYPYTSFRSSKEILGVGTFSKFPIESSKQIVSRSGHCQVLKIKAHNRDIFVINVHTESIEPKDIFGEEEKILASYKRREQMLIDILAYLSNNSIPVSDTILLGDFNSTEGNKLYQIIKKAGFKDSYRAVNPILFNGFTWPTNMRGVYKKLKTTWPFLRIDYIYTGNHFTTLNSETFQAETGSDHRPLVSNLAF